ncbi:MAG: transglutaminase-like domain-containing protein, partial [candidate division KSB1 bacterium]
MTHLRIYYTLLFAALLALITTHTQAENYVLAGKQNARIKYELAQRIVPMSGMKSLIISTVVPATFKSPTYNQEISDVRFDFQPQPSNQEEKLDARGNKVITATWSFPTTPITASVSLTAANWLQLAPLSTTAPFPVSAIAGPERVYLQTTKQVPANDPRILAKAKELTTGVTTEVDAVQRVLAWVIDHMTYVLVPESYEAMYSFDSGKGNCQNYSHLAAALLRSAGVPVRVVNGVTLKKSYDARVEGGNLTRGMGQGRHSWIDVYFPDLGWVPFDPQQSQLFTSNRYIRIEVGLDNEETTQDGLIRWTVARGTQGQPEFEETINADFPLDETAITAKRQRYGPKSLLLSPEVKATFVPYVAVVTPPPPPPQETPKDVPQADTPKPAAIDKPVIFGNLEFPEGVNFAFVTTIVPSISALSRATCSAT